MKNNYIMKRIQLFITGLSSGGAERQLVGLSILLKKNNYIVQVCWYANKNFYEPFLKHNGIDCKSLISSNHFKKVLNIKRAIDSFRPDVVISFLDGPNTICPFIKFFFYGKYKLIVSERSYTKQLNLRTRLRFYGYRFADYIVPNSRNQGQFIEQNYPNYINKIVTITNFCDLEQFRPIQKEENSPIRGVVAARLTEVKNVKRFIKAVSIAKSLGASFEVYWYGDAVNELYGNECFKMIEQYKVASCFRFFPATKCIENVYEKCDFVILPSLFEGFPNAICEAISCGLPVLCSDVCDNRMLVYHGINGFLFDPLSEKDIANSLLNFCKLTEEDRKKMGHEGRIIAEQLLSKDLFVNKYIRLLES